MAAVSCQLLLPEGKVGFRSIFMDVSRSIWALLCSCGVGGGATTEHRLGGVICRVMGFGIFVDDFRSMGTISTASQGGGLATAF